MKVSYKYHLKTSYPQRLWLDMIGSKKIGGNVKYIKYI